ncbi:MAG: hypothetical protein MJE77_36125 [Proteobacteria bacterium]|nr:hypothetical protein [Pseudomonadota bacterium]
MDRDHPGYLCHRLVVGYRGCDCRTAERVLLRGEHLRKSRNAYDWLGEGIYFWEHGYQRAAEFAQWKKTRGEIEDPVVIGAYIHLGRCFDLTDTWATSRLSDYYDLMRESFEQQERPMPQNRPAGVDDFDLVLRDLDCAVLNIALRMLDEKVGAERTYFQTVRGAFVEGEPAYQGACIHAKTHVQISVREQSCILGYFQPSARYTEGS